MAWIELGVSGKGKKCQLYRIQKLQVVYQQYTLKSFNCEKISLQQINPGLSSLCLRHGLQPQSLWAVRLNTRLPDGGSTGTKLFLIDRKRTTSMSRCLVALIELRGTSALFVDKHRQQDMHAEPDEDTQSITPISVNPSLSRQKVSVRVLLLFIHVTVRFVVQERRHTKRRLFRGRRVKK